MAVEITDVTLNWATVGEIAQSMLNAGIDKARELGSNETALLMASNVVTDNIVSQGVGSQDPEDVIEILRRQWKHYVNEKRNGLIPLTYQTKEDVH
jgi:hypothetical protein